MVIEVSEMRLKEVENVLAEFPEASVAFSACATSEQVFLELV